MDKILRQFRRIYADNGEGDVDFTKQEEKLRKSTNELAKAANDLVKAAENLNNIALSVNLKNKKFH